MTLNLRLGACLAMCLNFPRFQPQVAYKTVAYKKKKKKCIQRTVGFVVLAPDKSADGKFPSVRRCFVKIQWYTF